METITAGSVVPLFELAYDAGLPVLLHGPHGIGKSSLVRAAAARIGIGMIKVDLSLLEAPDLVGIPCIRDGRTEYAPPAFLPSQGTRGILMIEEINRAPHHMQAPCLELLTERRLHSYDLPGTWLPCGAVNPASDGYHSDELDPALLSRFLNVRVVADVPEWVAWAQQAGIHPKVVAFVHASPDVFKDPTANPRAWEQCSRFLIAWEKRGQGDSELLVKALAGYVGTKWAVAFHRVYTDQLRVLNLAEILDDYPAHRGVVRSWVNARQLDMIESSLKRLQHHLQAQRVYEAVAANPQQKANVEAFWSDVPAELQRQICSWLSDRGFTKLHVPVPTKRVSNA